MSSLDQALAAFRVRKGSESGSGGRSEQGAHLVVPGQIDASHNVVLYVEGVSVSFDGFKALNNLNLWVNDGELRCIIGPNGAGKTTMMDVITGKTRPDEGVVFLGQTYNLLRMSETDIAIAGIGRKFQRPTVFEQASVNENLWLAAAGPRNPRAALSRGTKREVLDRLAEVLKQVHLEPHANRIAGELSHGQKQWLEIGMLLMQKPRVLLLDEPVAGLSDEETAMTADLLLSLKGSCTLVVVEHDMHFVERLASKVTVLHHGSVLAEGDLASVQADERVIDVYLGR
jgi:urea transport system ATP-binding protein